MTRVDNVSVEVYGKGYRAQMSAGTYWENRANDDKLRRYLAFQPHGRISLYRWSEYHRRTMTEAEALAESGQLPGYIERGRWIALDLSVEPIELRLRLSGWTLPKPEGLAPDLEIRPNGKLWLKAKVGD